MKAEIGYKTVDLFGNETLHVVNIKNKKPNLFNQYEEFVDKFEVKKTTDDCYTPKEVYKIVLDYVGQSFDLTGKQIVRPFYPDGDYQAIDYNQNMVVIDNPPFSIITEICRFYIQNKVPFFLFAPHLTLFGADLDMTHIVTASDVVYENGAVVKTSFLSNMMGDAKIIGDVDLHNRLNEINNRNKVPKPKYNYPDNVLMVSQVAYMVEKGIPFRIDKGHTAHCRYLDDQKRNGKGMFGSGFLISDEQAQKKAAAEKAAKAAAEKAAAEKAAAEKANVIEWQLSNRERAVIDKLGKKHP